MNDKFRKQMVKTKLLTISVNESQNSYIPPRSCRVCNWDQKENANAILIVSWNFLQDVFFRRVVSSLGLIIVKKKCPSRRFT